MSLPSLRERPVLATKEIVSACVSCGVHLLLVASVWRISSDVIRADDRQLEQAPPLVAHFYDSSEPAPEAGAARANVAIDSSSAAKIEIGPPPELDAISSDSAQSARETRSAADYEEFERLQGMYRGQLFARLQRVLYELGPLEERQDVPCVLNVIQRTDGSVIDVLTDLCDYSPPSLALLRKAVGAASPLPLPPPGLAVGTYLTLDVSAYLATP
jgi:hypothetical protein